MFTIKKVLTPFLLPPGIFIISIILAGVWFLQKKNWRIGIVALVFGCFAWAFSISPVSDAMIRSLETEYSIPQKPSGDVIILLGRGVYQNAPDLSGRGAPADDYLIRIVTAVRLQKRLNIPIIVSGATGSNDKIAEDHIVKRFLTDLGVPARNIVIEATSRDTFENAKFSQEICERSNFANPILVTSAYHMMRAVMIFGKIGLEVTPFPTGFISYRDKPYNWKEFLPADFRKASIAIREYIGFIFYKVAY
jgi:uncharacterized SAM-binding protein YcdF (DUF218 family)